jgi:Kae1-associated kinase Bud32
MKLIYQGAEAKIYLEGDKIIKERVEKRYREKELDDFLRKTRTKKEVKLLSDLRRLGINVPRIIDYDKFRITMEFIEGKKLKDILSEENFRKFCREVGETVAKMHLADIIHGDLTTANIIVKDNKLYFIDFGLATETKNLEQKAADLLTLHQNFRSVHPEFNCWDYFLEGYKNKETEKILKVFEKMLGRRRYI